MSYGPSRKIISIHCEIDHATTQIEMNIIVSRMKNLFTTTNIVYGFQKPCENSLWRRITKVEVG